MQAAQPHALLPNSAATCAHDRGSAREGQRVVAQALLRRSFQAAGHCGGGAGLGQQRGAVGGAGAQQRRAGAGEGFGVRAHGQGLQGKGTTFSSAMAAEAALLGSQNPEHPESLVQAILPALKTVLAPPIRPMAAHLLSEPEQQLMTQTVAAMLDYCVSYDFQVAAAQEVAAGGAAAVYRPGGCRGCREGERAAAARGSMLCWAPRRGE